jgi:hypothetical protein
VLAMQQLGVETTAARRKMLRGTRKGLS